MGLNFTAHDKLNELKNKGLPWEKGIAFDNSSAIGKFIEIVSSMNKNSIGFTLKKNDEVIQKTNSSEMIYKFGSIVSTISNYISLNIGDLILTGTPAGSSECVVGDTLECFIDNTSLLKLEVK